MLTAAMVIIARGILNDSFVLPVRSGLAERRKKASSNVCTAARMRPELRIKWIIIR